MKRTVMAVRDLERKRALLSKDLIGRVDRDTAEALYESTVAQAQSARAQEQVLSAAIRGAEAQLEAAQASHQSSLATVRQKQAAQDLSRMQVETNVVEADIGRLKTGQRATFTVDAFPGKTFRGEVLQLRQAPQVTQGVVSYTVVVSAQNPDQQLLPGMTANVRIIAAEKTDVLKVPTAALRVRIPGDSTREVRERPKPAGGGERRPDRPEVSNRVHVVAPDGSLVLVALRLGVSDGNATEVLAGDLKEGQQVPSASPTGERPAARAVSEP
jgi:HlyD family secretion protein